MYLPREDHKLLSVESPRPRARGGAWAATPSSSSTARTRAPGQCAAHHGR